MLQIYLFGQLRAVYNNIPLKLSMRPKAYPLWAFLLLNHSQPIERNHLAFTFWPDTTEKKAKTNLRRHLHYLKQALPADHEWILADSRTIQWNPSTPSWLDVANFEMFAQSEDRLVDAINLYTADLLPSLYDDWLFYHRERLRDLYFSALKRLADQAFVQGDLPQSIDYTQKIITLDSLREDSVRQLMRLQYEVGNRAGAIAEYEQFVHHLGEELGVDPMPETVSLYEQIARNMFPKTATTQETAVSVTPPILASGPTKTILPFVGRQQEMAQLQNWWHRVNQGQGQFVFLAGEAGIGKTRLTGEFAKQVKQQNGRFLRGHTSFTEPTPYQAIVEALQSNISLLINLDLDPLWFAALRPILPELSLRMPDLPTAVSLAPAEEQARLFEAIYRCLDGLSKTRPLLFILEDLHWASPTTINLLENLARRLPESRILLIGTYREEETSRIHPLRRLRRRLQRQNLIHHLTISRLTPEAVKLLADQIEVKTDLAQKLYNRSEGNPLFIQELVHELERQPHLDWQTLIPGGVREIITQRLDQLSENARTLAEVTAVIGSAFDVELIRELSGWDEAEILDALDTLQDRYLIREAGRRDRFDYAFTHQLIQATIYEDISPALRRRRHRRIAQMITELYPQRLDEFAATIARHFDAANQPQDARPQYITAAKYALSLYADEEALTFLARGLELAKNPQLQFSFLILRQQIYHRQGEWEKQAVDLENLASIAEMENDINNQRLVLSWQIQHNHALGHRDAEEKKVTALQNICGEDAPLYWQAETMRLEANYLAIQSRYDTASPLYNQAMYFYTELDDNNGRMQCLCALANIATYQSDFNRVQQLVAEAQKLSAHPEVNQLMTIEAIHVAANALFVSQDFAQSETVCRQGLTLSVQIGYREGEASFHKLLGAIFSRRFMVVEAQEHYQIAHKLYDSLGKLQGQAAILINMAIIENRLGNYAEAMTDFAQAEQLFARLNDLRGQTISAINLGATAIFLEDFTTAKAASERGVALAQEMGSVHLEADALGNLGEALREMGELETAVSTLQTCINLRRSLDGQHVNLVSDMREMIIVYLRLGNEEAAVNTAVEMLEIFSQDAAEMLTPHHTFWVASQAFRQANQTTKANQLLQDAYDNLQTQTNTLTDAETKKTFLQRQINQQIIAAHQEFLIQ